MQSAMSSITLVIIYQKWKQNTVLRPHIDILEWIYILFLQKIFGSKKYTFSLDTFIRFARTVAVNPVGKRCINILSSTILWRTGYLPYKIESPYTAFSRCVSQIFCSKWFSSSKWIHHCICFNFSESHSWSKIWIFRIQTWFFMILGWGGYLWKTKIILIPFLYSRLDIEPIKRLTRSVENSCTLFSYITALLYPGGCCILNDIGFGQFRTTLFMREKNFSAHKKRAPPLLNWLNKRLFQDYYTTINRNKGLLHYFFCSFPKTLCWKHFLSIPLRFWIEKIGSKARRLRLRTVSPMSPQ